MAAALAKHRSICWGKDQGLNSWDGSHKPPKAHGPRVPGLSCPFLGMRWGHGTSQLPWETLHRVQEI